MEEVGVIGVFSPLTLSLSPAYRQAGARGKGDIIFVFFQYLVKFLSKP